MGRRDDILEEVQGRDIDKLAQVEALIYEMVEDENYLPPWSDEDHYVIRKIVDIVGATDLYEERSK